MREKVEWINLAQDSVHRRVLEITAIIVFDCFALPNNFNTIL